MAMGWLAKLFWLSISMSESPSRVSHVDEISWQPFANHRRCTVMIQQQWQMTAGSAVEVFSKSLAKEVEPRRIGFLYKKFNS